MMRRRLAVAALVCLACSPPAPKPIDTAAPMSSAKEPAGPALSGRVVDERGHGVFGAVVTATSKMDWSAETPTAHFAVSDERGEFRFEKIPDASYSVRASTPHGWASAAEPIVYAAASPSAPIQLALAPSGLVVRGVVRDEAGKPVVDAKVEALALLPTDADPAFGAVTNAMGEYAMMLPEGTAFLLIGTSAERRRAYGRVDAAVRTTDLELPAKPMTRPDDGALTEWLAKDAFAIETDDPSHEGADLEPFVRSFGDATVVGLGEATHGTAEFFRLKHRLVRLMVTKLDFSVVAFECGAVEARAVNAYVQKGVGDPVEVVRKLGTDPYATEEIVAFVRWMRAHNADRRHTKKLTFAGFDATSWTSVAALRAFLQQVKHTDPQIDAALTRLEGTQADSTYPALDRALHEQTRVALASLRTWLTTEREALVKAVGEPTWTDANEHVVRLAELERSFLDPTLRDTNMAEEVERIRTAHSGARTALWLHNAHASAWPRPFAHMGTELRRRHGSGYVSVGFTFGEGTFRALTRGDMAPGPVEQRIKGPVEDSFDAALTLAKPPMFAVDLRVAKGVIRDWLATPAVVTEVGFVSGGEAADRRWTVPSRAYDIVVHVDSTRAAAGLPKKTTKAQSTSPGGKRSP